jgi:ethanolamine utilization protein EutA (predicted chaperonin)
MMSRFFCDLDIGGGETKYFHFKTVDLKSVQIARSDTKIRLIWTNRHQKVHHRINRRNQKKIKIRVYFL